MRPHARRFLGWGTAGVLPVLVFFAFTQLRELIATVRLRFADAGNDPAFAQLAPAGKPPSDSVTIGFRDLRFASPDAAGASATSPARDAVAVPDSIRKLDGRAVRLHGYMVPTRADGAHVQECIVVASQMNCCYGQPPSFCEFVVARITGNDVPVLMDVPLAFTGTLHVREVVDPSGSIPFYTLDCTAVER